MMFESFAEIPLSNMHNAVVPVVVVSPETFRYIGTAFNISPSGVFVTAGHVIDEAIKVQAQVPDSNIAVTWIGSGVGHDVQDLVGGSLLVSSYTKFDEYHSDLALFRVAQGTQYSPFPLTCLKLSTRLPRVDEAISGAGYPKPAVESDSTTAETRTLTVVQSLHFTPGKVTQVFEEQRDKIMLPGPGFETSARFDSGMSGGPVFNEDGYVCGVISFSLPPDEEYSGHTSYASLALVLYTMWILDGAEDNEIAVYELAKQGIVGTDEFFDSAQPYKQDNGRLGVNFPPREFG
jgi:V8-like Glu-specific endopeptidase